MFTLSYYMGLITTHYLREHRKLNKAITDENIAIADIKKIVQLDKDIILQLKILRTAEDRSSPLNVIKVRKERIEKLLVEKREIIIRLFNINKMEAVNVYNS
jgi:hypothetical protein